MKHFYINATTLWGAEPLLKCGTKEYLKMRLQFWKWRKQRTGGRPVLVLRKRAGAHISSKQQPIR